MAFISIVPRKASLSWGVPSRPTVRPPPEATARHVDHDGERPERHGGLDRHVDVAVVVDIAGHGDGLLAEVVGQGAGPVAVPVEDGHAAARLDEATDRRLTQATGAAGDQC